MEGSGVDSEYMRDGGLTQTESKLEAGGNVVLVESAVVDEQIPVGIVARGDRGTVVRCLLRDGVGQFARGRCGAVYDVYETVSRFLTCSLLMAYFTKGEVLRRTGKTSPNNSNDVGVLDPALHEDGANTVHNNDSLLVDLGDCLDKFVSVVPGVEVRPVTRVALDRDVTLTCISINADDGNLGVLSSRSSLRSVVVGRAGDSGSIFLSLGLDGVKWCDKVGNLDSSGTPAHDEGSLIATAVDTNHYQLHVCRREECENSPCVRATRVNDRVRPNNGDALWFVQRQSSPCVLQ